MVCGSRGRGSSAKAAETLLMPMGMSTQDHQVIGSLSQMLLERPAGAINDVWDILGRHVDLAPPGADESSICHTKANGSTISTGATVPFLVSEVRRILGGWVDRVT